MAHLRSVFRKGAVAAPSRSASAFSPRAAAYGAGGLHRRFPGEPNLGRSFVLLLVLVLIAGASAAAVVITSSALGHRQEWSGHRQREAARLLALGGLERVLAEVSAQRAALLAGGAPALTTDWAIPALNGANGQGRGVIRLRRVFADESTIDGSSAGFAEPQAALVDVTRAPREMLARLKGLAPDQLTRIMRERDRSGAPMSWLGLRKGMSNDSPPPPLTCYAFEVDRTVGVPGLGLLSPGEARVRRGSSERDGSAGAASESGGFTLSPGDEALSTLLIRSRRLDDDRDFKPSWVVRQLIEAKLDPEHWGCVLDAIGFSESGSDGQPGFRAGLIDINRASADVLACIPGIDPVAAASIVDRRGSLAPESARSVAWPLTEGLLTREQFVQAVDVLTTRSLVWRVEIEAGFEPLVPDRTDGSQKREELTHPAVLEAVIDGNGPRARIAALREVTSRDAAEDLRAFLAPAAPALGKSPADEVSNSVAEPEPIEAASSLDSTGPAKPRSAGSVAQPNHARTARHGRWMSPASDAADRPAPGYIESSQEP